MHFVLSCLEEPLEYDDLANGRQEDGQGAPRGPHEHALVEHFGALTSLGLAHAVVPLVRLYASHALVYLLRILFHLQVNLQVKFALQDRVGRSEHFLGGFTLKKKCRVFHTFFEIWKQFEL